MEGTRFQKVINWFLGFFKNFENAVIAVVAVIIGAIIFSACITICAKFYKLFVLDFFDPHEITFSDYQELFGQILTLLIGLEFLSSILKSLKAEKVKFLVNDVLLITALAIARKLIIYDYDDHEPFETLTLGAILIAIGIFYFLVTREGVEKLEPNEKTR